MRVLRGGGSRAPPHAAKLAVSCPPGPLSSPRTGSSCTAPSVPRAVRPPQRWAAAPASRGETPLKTICEKYRRTVLVQFGRRRRVWLGCEQLVEGGGEFLFEGKENSH